MKKILIPFCFLALLATQALGEDVHYIPVDTEVNYGLAGFVKRGIADAREAGAKAIILGIDTFGGRVDACLDIVNHIDSASPIPIYAFIEDKAWSAGALIALANDGIFMRKGSSIGSAAPVASQGSDTKALGEKHVSAIRAKFRSVAEKKGYPPNLAAAMVDKDLEVREVLVDGKKQYLTPDEIEDVKKSKSKVEVGEWISKKDKLLNLTAEQAKAYGFITAVTENTDAVLAAVKMGQANLIHVKRNWAEHSAGFVTGAMVSGLLLTIGILALYLEFQSPGFGWPGITGIICLALVFWGKYMVFLADWTEILLFSIGITLILIEIFVIPGFGFAGILGTVCVLLGIYLSFVPFIVPSQPWDYQRFQETLITILVSLTVSTVGIVTMIHYMKHIPLLNRLVLTETLEAHDVPATPKSNISEMVGRKGVCLTDLRPVGRARFGKKIMDVETETSFIRRGRKVVVSEARNNRILVREV